MNDYMKQFISIFDAHYPYTRYIIEHPHAFSNLSFGMLRLSEFVVYDEQNVLVKFKTLRGYEDIMFKIEELTYNIQEEVRNAILEDFGRYAFECLYVEHEDNSQLEKILENQRQLLEMKYGTALVKQREKIY